MFALKWPWVAGHRKGKEKRSQMIGGDPKQKWGSLPLRGSKKVFEQVSWQTGDSHFTPGKRQKTNWDTKDSKILQACIKNSTKSISPWKKKNSPVEPRQKNKISNFGTFFLYTQILFTTLSLSLNLKKDKSQEKTFIFMDYPIIYFWHFERIYIYNRSKEPMYFHFTKHGLLG